MIDDVLQQIHYHTALLTTHTHSWVNGYLLSKKMVFQWSNNMEYTCHKLEINANLFPLTKAPTEKLFFNIGLFN